MNIGNFLAQLAAVTRFGVGTVPQRLGSTLSAFFGIACVVAVLVAVLSMAAGFRRTMTAGAMPSNAIVLRAGANDEMSSGLSLDEVRLIRERRGIRQSSDGPMASGEVFVVINLPKRSTGTDANVPLRGVEPAAFEVREKLDVVEGRPFEPGRNEVVVGRSASLEFTGLDLGATIEVGSERWEVVGIFEEGGGLSESEIWADVRVLQQAYRRGSGFNSVHVLMESPEAFQGFKDELTSDPRLQVRVEPLDDFLAEKSEATSALIRKLGFLIAGLMGLGAVAGALNTMYTAVSTRTREIATLRALGFGAVPVVFSVLIEAVLIALVGGLAGAGAAYLIFDGFRAATINFQTFSQVAFAFRVSPDLVATGVTYSAILGAVGGFFPALRAARMPIAAGLREE